MVVRASLALVLIVVTLAGCQFPKKSGGVPSPAPEPVAAAVTPEPSKPEVTLTGKTSRDRAVRWQVTSVQAEIDGQTVPLTCEDVEPVVDQLLSRAQAVAGEQTEVIIRVVCSQEKSREQSDNG